MGIKKKKQTKFQHVHTDFSDILRIFFFLSFVCSYGDDPGRLLAFLYTGSTAGRCIKVTHDVKSSSYEVGVYNKILTFSAAAAVCRCPMSDGKYRLIVWKKKKKKNPRMFVLVGVGG